MKIFDYVFSILMKMLLIISFCLAVLELYKIHSIVEGFKLEHLSSTDSFKRKINLLISKNVSNVELDKALQLDGYDKVDFKYVNKDKDSDFKEFSGLSSVELSLERVFIEYPLFINNKALGTLKISTSNIFLINSLRTELLFFLISQLLILFLFLSVSRKVSRDVVKPISNLSIGINQILDSGDLSLRLSEDSLYVEYQRLTSLLNQLVKELDNSRVDLNMVNKSLENLVTAKTKKLTHTLDEMKKFQSQLVAQEKLASLGALTAGIAHEIKNPLNLIINSSQIIAMVTDKIDQSQKLKLEGKTLSCTEKDISEIQRASRVIVDNGFRADAIVKSMLSQSRGQESTLSSTNIGQIVERALNLCTHAHRAKFNSINVKIIKKISPNINMMAYPEDLERAFINIIENSFYAMKDRSRLDSNYKACFEVSLSLKDDKEVEICFEDNGIGVSDDIKEKIFEPFFTTKPTGIGTGLGMGMVSDVVYSHKGIIELTSEVNNFTKFKLKLAYTKIGNIKEAS